MRVAGVDGTKSGWVAIILDSRHGASGRLLPGVEFDFGTLDAEVIAIDVPIGFGPRRAADPAARAYLKGAASTVFTTPAEGVLRRPFGRGLGVTAQAHALGPRIIHCTTLARRDPRLREAHPEVSFREMNGGAALEHKKKSAGGMIERMELLRKHGIGLGSLADAATAPMDVVLDAAACAWTARRIAAGSARSLPDPPETNGELAVAIWY